MLIKQIVCLVSWQSWPYIELNVLIQGIYLMKRSVGSRIQATEKIWFFQQFEEKSLIRRNIIISSASLWLMASWAAIGFL